MGREDHHIVRHQSIPSLGESNSDRAIMNKFGAAVVVDLVTQWLLSGYCFHMQTGTEDAPITTNGPLDDTKPVMLADNNSGVIVPLLYEVSIAAHSTSTAIEAMLEVDMDKKRYSSGGTVYVPEQMNNAATSAAAANGTFYTIEGSDIVALAKTAVPASIELARKTLSEDAIGDPAGAQIALDKIFSIRERPPVIANTPSSICAHFGSATADVTGYGQLEFAQFAAALAW
jgi:hypothetical protein